MSTPSESEFLRTGTGWLHDSSPLGLQISLGDVPADLPDARSPLPWIHVTKDQVLVQFWSGAGLLVSEGRRATVHLPADPTWHGDPAWIIQGWAVTLASLQRGQLSVHAATADIDGHVIAVAGGRGAGKSTTAMGLRSRGHALLVDDVALVEFRGPDAWTIPYARNVHLLPDAAQAMGLDFDRLPLLAGGREKAAFPADPPPPDPRRIESIVVLSEATEADQPATGAGRAAGQPPAGRVQVTEIRGAQRFAALLDHTSREGVAPLVLGEAAYFAAVARLASACRVFSVRRPAHAWSLDAVLDAVQAIASEPTTDQG